MLNTKKLLYLLPDAAYLAELLPTKKPHSFSIQSFRQVNGEFINEDELIADNVDKLIKKIEPDDYHLILPDFLFTNTMVDIAFTKEHDVKAYLKEQLLPDLGLSKETHELDTFILTQHQGKSKVQLSAIEKSLLVPLQKACQEQHVGITNISPLSWTIKAVVSLEPSLSTIQMGGYLFLAQHYIGVDQAISFKIEETANIVETVKTLKGGEPNIQTMYLLTNPLVESELKEKLSGTLPLQQLANFAEEQQGIPSFIREIIEATAKTLDITDFPVPRFQLGSYEPETTKEKAEEKVESTKTKEASKTKDEEKEKNEEREEDNAEGDEPIPPPSAPPSPAVVAAAETTSLVAMTTLEKTTALTAETEKDGSPEQEERPSVVRLDQEERSSEVSSVKTSSVESVADKKTESLTPIIHHEHDTLPSKGTVMSPASLSAFPTSPIGIAKTNRPVIKNKNEAWSVVKIVLITLSALVGTVVVGVGVGFGILKFSERNVLGLNQPVVVEPSTTPEPSTEPSPSPSPVVDTSSVDKKKVKILIVNATGVSGKAGKVKTTLSDAGYTNIATGNAKDTYTDSGVFILMAEPQPALQQALETDSKLTLIPGEDASVEDPKGAYDAVIVLNDEE